MITVREQFEHCVKYESIYMAHLLHYMLKEGMIKLEDDFSKIDFRKVDGAKVSEMVEQNYLCFLPIKIFSLKVDDYLFAFVFAKTKEEAMEFMKSLNEKPRNCFEYPLDLEMYREGRVLTFREMKKEHESFPALVGYFERNPAYR